MNTHQLQRAIDCDSNMNGKICGVYAVDDIPEKYNTRLSGFIANTDPHTLPGRHWVAFFIDENGDLETFDSYGNSPSLYSENIKRYMNNFERNINNTKRLQSSETRVCGQYCLFYLMCRCKGYSLNDIIKVFSGDFRLNDQFVYNFIYERFSCCMYTTSRFCQSCVNQT